MKIIKKISIKAGMEFTYPGTKNNKLRIIGYKIMEFIYNIEGQLVGENEMKRVIY